MHVEYSGTYLGKKKVTKADYNRIEKACRGEIKFKNITNKNIAKMKQQKRAVCNADREVYRVQAALFLLLAVKNQEKGWIHGVIKWSEKK